MRPLFRLDQQVAPSEGFGAVGGRLPVDGQEQVGEVVEHFGLSLRILQSFKDPHRPAVPALGVGGAAG